MTARIAVLASGGGSNLQALLDYLQARGASRCGDVVVVGSNKRDAGALERARRAGIAAAVLRGPNAPEGSDLLHELTRHRVDFVALAGYLKLIPKEIMAEYPSRVLNIHPALLPAFGGPGMYGDRVHRAVLQAGMTRCARSRTAYSESSMCCIRASSTRSRRAAGASTRARRRCPTRPLSRS
jgi:folate-dependent phosphoribosylglycinamide formyltransferase PurN